MTWRMLVTTAAGGTRDAITPADAIASLDGFSVDHAGSCLEAEWAARPDSVDVRARDVITLETTDDEVTWTPRYRGVVMQAGNVRSPDLQSYRAVGLKQRFHELILTTPRVAGADVATMVQSVLSSLSLPEGVTYAAADVPTTGFELGDRYPQLESVGDFLDALASMVGAFIVPSGSYAYDGVTYAVGQTVPAVSWGVRANGGVFFRRPQAAVVSVDEADTLALVEWLETSAEDAVDRVTLVYASDYNGSPDANAYGVAFGNPYTKRWEPKVGHPIARAFGTGSVNAALLKPLDTPLDLMTSVTLTYQGANPALTSAASATDGSETTYAQLSDFAPNSTLATWRATGYVEGAIEVVFAKLATDSEFAIWGTWRYADNNLHTLFKYDFTNLKSTDKQWFVAPLLVPVVNDASEAQAYTDIVTWVWTDGTNSDRVYSVRYYVPDVDAGEGASERYALTLTRPVRENVSVITTYELRPVTQAVTLTPLAGNVTTLDVARTEYALTTSEGAVTRYHIEHEYPADLMTERVVLERLARKATR